MAIAAQHADPPRARASGTGPPGRASRPRSSRRARSAPPHDPARLKARGTSWRAPGGTAILAPISSALEPGRLMDVVGANGAGKSTLLRLLY